MLKSHNYGIRLHQQLQRIEMIQKRSFWEYVNMMFNKPDPERIKLLGPDRTCAEWVLRNGGKVVWNNGKILADYNSLPSEDRSVPKIIEIDATDSGISHYGFPHLIGCNMLSKITLHNNSYIEDKAMKSLSFAKDTLKQLQISKCINVTDAGLKELQQLKNLETLILFDMQSVSNLQECKAFLQSQLSNLKIKDAAKEENENQQ